MSKRLERAKFAVAIGQDLLKFSEALFTAFGGNPERASAHLRRITNYKELMLEDRAAVDAELAALRKSREGSA